MKNIRYLLPVVVALFLAVQFVGFSLYAVRQRAFIVNHLLDPKHIVNHILRKGIRGGRWLTRLDGEIALLVSGKIRSRQVLSGLNGWLFYQSKTDGDPIGDYQGEIRYSENEQRKLKEELSRLNNFLETKDIDFAFIVAPNKEVMYAEYMPRKIKQISPISRTEEMMEGIKKSKVKSIYVKRQLQENKDIKDLYYPLDTHWNLLGGYVGTQCVLELLGRERKELCQCKIVQDVPPFRYDLPKIALAEHVYKSDELMWRVDGLHNPKGDDFTAGESTGQKYISKNLNASGTLIIIGDSFRIAMLPLLVDEYKEVYCLHRGECKDIANLVDAVKPNAVILEAVERYSGGIGDYIESSLYEY